MFKKRLVTPWSVFFTTPPRPLTSPPHTRWAGVTKRDNNVWTSIFTFLLSQLIEQWKQIAANLVILVATNLVMVFSLVVFNWHSLVLLFWLWAPRLACSSTTWQRRGSGARSWTRATASPRALRWRTRTRSWRGSSSPSCHSMLPWRWRATSCHLLR